MQSISERKAVSTMTASSKSDISEDNARNISNDALSSKLTILSNELSIFLDSCIVQTL